MSLVHRLVFAHSWFEPLFGEASSAVLSLSRSGLRWLCGGRIVLNWRTRAVFGNPTPIRLNCHKKNAFQVLWEQARDARTLVALEESMAVEDHRRRQTSFSELLLRHLVTGLLQAPSTCSVVRLTHKKVFFFSCASLGVNLLSPPTFSTQYLLIGRTPYMHAQSHLCKCSGRA